MQIWLTCEPHLSGDRVRTGWEQLGDASNGEALLSKTEGGTKTGTTSTDDDGVIVVVDDRVATKDGSVHPLLQKTFVRASRLALGLTDVDSLGADHLRHALGAAEGTHCHNVK